MTYNLLLIDENISYHNTLNILEPLDAKRVYYGPNEDTIKDYLKRYKIHVIILNTNYFLLEELDRIIGALDKKYSEIPILLVGDYDNIELYTHLLIYDIIDIHMYDKIILNKIKYFQILYKRELEHESDIRKLLYIDNLTKLPNRIKLIHDIQDKSIGIDAIAVIDLNSFKEINDFFGHRIGDNILKKVVDIINEMIKFIVDKVELYKFSADVYCLANKKLSHNDFENMVTYILGSIESNVIKEDEHEIDIRATAGITFSPKNNKLITADLALHSAKKQNKNYLVFYEELDNIREYENNMLWTKKLKKAMESDNIIVYFQPLVNNKTMKVDKYECLVRMLDDEKVISPFFFLDISKKANKYANITKIVIEKSFQEFEFLDFEFSINVSYEDIQDSEFIGFIKEKLAIYDVSNRVVWEILEDEGIKNYDILFEFIKEVKSLGCKVAIDDFGSGYSNFEHLLKMDVDYLKIDASLIKNIAVDENSYKVVKTIIEFANSLNLKTIAEYVENKNIFDITKELGTNYSQGYHFSAPIPKPILEKF
ncbi:MAG: EAL domain-containing protein [Campylobacterota bacterium]|nr:EAL domain-containing protein [Campylobacterota bacterium]